MDQGSRQELSGIEPLAQRASDSRAHRGRRGWVMGGVAGGMMAMSGAMWGLAQVGSQPSGGGGVPAGAPGPSNPTPRPIAPSSPRQPGDKTPIERPPAPTSPPTTPPPADPNAPANPGQGGQPGGTGGNGNGGVGTNNPDANETPQERLERLRRAGNGAGSGPFAFSSPQSETAFHDNVQNLMRMERRMDESRRALLKRLGDVRQMPPERQSAATLDLLQQILQEQENAQMYLVRSRAAWTGDVNFREDPAMDPNAPGAARDAAPIPPTPAPERGTGQGR